MVDDVAERITLPLLKGPLISRPVWFGQRIHHGDEFFTGFGFEAGGEVHSPVGVAAVAQRVFRFRQLFVCGLVAVGVDPGQERLPMFGHDRGGGFAGDLDEVFLDDVGGVAGCLDGILFITRTIASTCSMSSTPARTASRSTGNRAGVTCPVGVSASVTTEAWLINRAAWRWLMRVISEMSMLNRVYPARCAISASCISDITDKSAE